MIQRELDEILEAATSIKLVGRMIREMEMDCVERGTCALIVDQAVGAILTAIEKVENELAQEVTG